MYTSGFKPLFLAIFLVFLGTQTLAAQGFFHRDSLQTAPAKSKPIIDRWIAPDKGLHLLGSMMVTIAASKTLEQEFDLKARTGRQWAMGFTLSLGIGKELWDSTKPHNIFSWKDLSADMVGIILGRGILAFH